MTSQLPLPMLTVYHGPRLLPLEEIQRARSYRDIVRICWAHRTRKHLSQRTLAEETGMLASHITDYLSEDDAKRDMPAKYVQEFEVSMGNRAITQWFAYRAQLNLLEALPATVRAVAVAFMEQMEQERRAA